MSNIKRFNLNEILSPNNINLEIPIQQLISDIKIENETSSKFKIDEIKISNASSSIYFTQGECKFLIAIFGPRETKFREKIKNEEANIEIYTKFSIETNKEYTTYINSKIKKFVKKIILTKSYPKCQININISILKLYNNSNILLSSIFNGIMITLCLSGIDLKSMVLSKGFCDNKNSILLSIDANENENILNFDSENPLSITEYENYYNKTILYINELYNNIKLILYQKLKNN
jgi:ribonuclease PH